MDESECLTKLDDLEQTWVSYGTDETNTPIPPTFENIFRKFSHNTEGLLTTSDLIKKLQVLGNEAAELSNRMFALGTLNNNRLVNRRITRLMEVVGYMFVLANSTLRIQQSVENCTEPVSFDSSFYNFSVMTGVVTGDTDDTKPYQKLIIHLCCQAQLKGYRRYGDHVYQPLITSTGHNTHSWEQVCDIRTFIFESCRRDFHWKEWKLLTDHPSYVKNATAYLTDCEDRQFPRLTKDRSAFSFSNGIYLAGQDAFITYGSAAAQNLPNGLCCAKHFPVDFPLEHVSAAWSDIPTPIFLTILGSQDFNHAVARWLFVFLGRLLYEVGERDNW